MAENSHWRHGRVKMISPSIRTNDSYFPFSPSVIRATNNLHKTLPFSYAQNLIPPIEVVTKLYYEDAANSFEDGSLRARTGHGDPYTAPRQMQQEEAWKTITEQDFNYASGFRRGVILVGMTARLQDDDHVVMPYRPALEKCIFDWNPGRLEFMEPRPTEHETRARWLLELSQAIYVKWSGCAQTPLFRSRDPTQYCCEYTPRVDNEQEEERQKRDRERFLGSATCPRNKGIETIVNKMDLNVPTMSGAFGTHCFLFRPDDNRVAQNIQIIEAVDEERIVLPRLLLEDLIDEFEIGFFEPDSSVQRSLAMNDRREMQWKRHPMLENSHRFRKEYRHLRESLPGPCLANEDQLFQMSNWERHQIEDTRRWPRRETPQGLSLLHPGMFMLDETERESDCECELIRRDSSILSFSRLI